MSAEPKERESTPAADPALEPWWTAAVPGLVVAVGVVAGLALGVALGAAPGAIFLGGAVLVGAILLFWSSVRLLLGEKLPGVDLSDELAGRVLEDPLLEKKRAALAALADMERERELGKISAADYDEVVLPLRERAKSVLRELDARAAPFRSDAERIAQAHLAKAGLGGFSAEAPEAPAAQPSEQPAEAREAPAEPSESTEPLAAEASASSARIACPACEATNEPDAKFCKSCGKVLEIPHAS